TTDLFVDVDHQLLRLFVYMLFFFFQAEDGIRDRNVTGVQTCALPISSCTRSSVITRRSLIPSTWAKPPLTINDGDGLPERRSIRSEERRVGKECRGRK